MKKNKKEKYKKVALNTITIAKSVMEKNFFLQCLFKQGHEYDDADDNNLEGAIYN